jgi:hypothetical protein
VLFDLLDSHQEAVREVLFRYRSIRARTKQAVCALVGTRAERVSKAACDASLRSTRAEVEASLPGATKLAAAVNSRSGVEQVRELLVNAGRAALEESTIPKCVRMAKELLSVRVGYGQ